MENKENDRRKYMINLETDRLLLRNISDEDKRFIIDLWTDPDVTKYLGGPRDKQNMKEGVEDNIRYPYKDEYDLWVLIIKSSNVQIGHCGLLRKNVEGNDEVELIYVIDKKHWGNGFATEIAVRLLDYAFHEKKLDSVIALIKPGNIASEKVARKTGMKFEKEVIRSGDIKMCVYRTYVNNNN